MSAETGTEPDAPKKRGRIPQSAWPGILERYRAGQTLSAIAREFDCTPSAISYIVRKAEAAGDTGEAAGHEEPAAEGAEAKTKGDEAAGGASGAVVAAPAPSARTQEAAPAPVAETQVSEPRPVERRPKLTRPIDQPREATVETRTAPAAVAAPTAAPAPAPVAVAPVPQPPVAQPTQATRPEPVPPVDEVEQRLRETARGCLNAYRGWRQTPGENSIQLLHDAVHDLRKALARIEIDMSASRRDEQVARPIPIPAHRAARRPK